MSKGKICEYSGHTLPWETLRKLYEVKAENGEEKYRCPHCGRVLKVRSHPFSRARFGMYPRHCKPQQ